ncbi:MAG: hypothetical protein Q4G03_07200 [Planctomycetia bacterium]|nr:hypothetical protein [Planctomycetia bacterium]
MQTYPLALFEEYMARDTSMAYPMDTVLVLRFDGLLQRQALEESVRLAATRQPLISGRLQSQGRQLFWTVEKTDFRVEWIDYDSNPTVLNSQGYPKTEPLDLTRAPIVRFFVIESPSEHWSRFVLQIHHSNTDGMGQMNLVHDILFLYGQQVGAIDPNLPLAPVDVDKLKLRYPVGWSLKSYLRNYFHTMRSTWQLAIVAPKPLVSMTRPDMNAPEKDAPHSIALPFTKEETAQYIRRAKSYGVTVNDLLLCDYYKTTTQWRHAKGVVAPRGKNRVMTPINMRQKEHENIPLTNIVSTVFIDRTERQIKRPYRRLLEGIHREMQWVKRRDQRYVFLLALKVLRCLPGSLDFFLKMPTCRATGVLTNLGRVLNSSAIPHNDQGQIVLGDVVLTHLEPISPIRYKTAIAIVAFTYANELNLGLHYDSRVVTEQDARLFLNLLKRQALLGEEIESF